MYTEKEGSGALGNNTALFEKLKANKIIHLYRQSEKQWKIEGPINDDIHENLI